MTDLGALPLEPQVVAQGDSRVVDFLNNPGIAFTQAFNKMVEAVVSQSQGHS